MIKIFAPQLQLSPVPVNGNDPANYPQSDDSTDEIDQAIADDPITHDNRWELKDNVDGAALADFWTQVVDDLHKDPTWTDFSKEQ